MAFIMSYKVILATRRLLSPSMTLIKAVNGLPWLEMQLSPRILAITSNRFYGSKKPPKKGSKKVTVDDILEELSDDEDEEDVGQLQRRSKVGIPETKAAKFIEDWDKFGGHEKGKKKDKGQD